MAGLAESTDNDYLISVYHRIADDLARVGTLLLESELAGRISFTASATRTDRLLSDNADGAAEDVLQFIEQARGQVLEIRIHWPSVVSSEVRPLRSGSDRQAPELIRCPEQPSAFPPSTLAPGTGGNRPELPGPVTVQARLVMTSMRSAQRSYVPRTLDSPSATARWYKQRSAATRCSSALRPPRALRRATTWVLT